MVYMTEQKKFSQAGEQANLLEHQEAMRQILCEFDRVCRLLNIPYFLFAGTLLGAVRHSGFIPWDDDLDVLMLRKDYERFLREAPLVMDLETFFLQQEYTEHWPMFFSKIRINGTSCLEKHHPKDDKTHQGVYIDIFPCDNAFESELMRRVQFACSKIIIAKGLDGRGYYTESNIKKAFMVLCRIMPRKPFLAIVKGPKKSKKFVHTFLGAASRYSKNVYPFQLFAEPIEMRFDGASYPVPKEYHKLLTIMYGDYMQLPPEEDRACKEHNVLVDLKKSYEYYKGYRDGMKFENPIKSIR